MRLNLFALILTVSLSACSHNQVTPGEVCMEIPFIDAPEGACVHNTTHKATLVPAAEWKERRKFMLMIDAKYWTDIKKDWLEGCRIAGPSCNVQVDSVDTAVRALDEILGKFFPVLPKP